MRLAAPLAERGVELTAVLPAEGEAAANRMREGGVETLTTPLARLRASADPRTQGRLLRELRGDLRRLRGTIRDRSIDVVQVHGVTNPQGAIAARLEPGTGVVWQLFDTRAPMPVRRASLPMVLALSDSMTTWGEGLADAHPGVRRLGDRRLTVFPPVDTASFRPDPAAREAARRRLGIAADETLVATLGVRNPQKGHEWFVRAAGRIAAADPRARFRILGAESGAHQAHMREVEGEAERLGLRRDGRLAFVDPGREVPLLMQAVDVFAMSSVPRSEGMPTAILEAMACGKPVVATDAGATSELIEERATGYLVPALNAEALAEAALRLTRDPALRRSTGEAARRRAEAHFGLARLAAIHGEAYAIARERAHSRLQSRRATRS